MTFEASIKFKILGLKFNDLTGNWQASNVVVITLKAQK